MEIGEREGLSESTGDISTVREISSVFHPLIRQSIGGGGLDGEGSGTSDDFGLRLRLKCNSGKCGERSIPGGGIDGSIGGIVCESVIS